MIENGRILQQRYRVQRQIGQGGMGAVYVATDERFGSTVAIKETLCMDDNFRKAIEREARLLNSLKHNSLPRVTDHFEEDNILFIVMEYIPGDDVAAMLEKRHAFEVDKVLQWADQLLDALDYLHNQELPVIHRDIKPQNLKINSRGEIILLDFGLAKGNPADSGHQTAAKSIFGYSRNYASLEQIQGTGTDPRSDLYSLAATLYHMLTGTAPDDALTRAMSVLNKQPDPMMPASVRNSSVPAGIAAVLHRSLDLNASERPATAKELRSMLSDHERYTDLLDDIEVGHAGDAPHVLSQQTKLMHDATRPAAKQQTEVKTRIMSDGLSEVTAVSSARPADGGSSNIVIGSPARKHRFGIGAAALALLLVGIAIAGGLFAVDPSLFGTEPTESNTTEAPVSADAVLSEQVANADPNSAAAAETTAGEPTNSDRAADPPARTADRPAETGKNNRSQTAARADAQAEDEDPTVDIEMDDPWKPRQVIITERGKDGKVKVTRVNPSAQLPGANYNPFPNGFDHERLTPEQREKVREALRRIPKPPIVKTPPIQP